MTNPEKGLHLSSVGQSPITLLLGTSYEELTFISQIQRIADKLPDEGLYLN